MVNLYPGVQTSRIPSGFRSIATVGTSTTAFIGIFERGPVDKATRITSWGQFQEKFGGLWKPSDASYAVQHYFLNGGNVAYIVRTTWGAAPQESTVSLNIAAGLALKVDANSEGDWGNNLYVGIGANTDAAKYDLIIREYDGDKIVAEETYAGLSTSASDPRYASKVINGVSNLINVTPTDTRRPANSNGTDNLTVLAAMSATAFKTNTSQLTTGADGRTIDNSTPAIWTPVALTALEGSDTGRTGIYALDDIAPDTFNLLCIPVLSRMTSAASANMFTLAKGFCKTNYAFMLIDTDASTPANVYSSWFTAIGTADAEYSAGVFPLISFDDPEDPGTTRTMGASGIMAGLIAKTDANRGFFKSPAGIETAFAGGELEYSLTNLEHEPLNRSGVVCLRKFPVFGAVNWGARTLAGADDLAHEYKYMAVARTALVIEASLKRGLQWAVFEGNDEVLHGQIRLSVNAFMQTLHRKGAFQGKSAKDAYFVKCDYDTTTQADIDQGIVNVIVGFAPLKPAEFVFISIQQIVQAAT